MDTLKPFPLEKKIENIFSRMAIIKIIEAERCGWGAVSLKLVIEPAPYINRKPRYRFWKKEDYLAFSAETRLIPEQMLRLLDKAHKKTREIRLLANIAYVGDRGMDGWVELAKRCADAGASVVGTTAKRLAIPELCTGCSTCMDFCPVNAISFVDRMP